MSVVGNGERYVNGSWGFGNETHFRKESVSTSEDVLPTWHVAAQSTSLVFILILALGGNFLVAFTLFKKDQLPVPSNRLVFSLTASNFALALVVLPFAVTSVLSQQWLFGIFWCNFTAFITVLVLTSTILTIAMIAIDRYYAIVKPLMYSMTITNSRSSVFLLVVWLLGFVCSLPPLFGLSRFHYRPSEAICMIDWSHNIYYTSFVLLAGYFVPFITMVVCYYFILQVARAKCRKIHIGTVTNPQMEAQSVAVTARIKKWSMPSCKSSWVLMPYASPAKGLRTICLVVGMFVVTSLPYVILSISEASGFSSFWPKWFHTVATCLLFFSSASHPVVYGLLNRSIRKEVKACVWPSRSRSSHGLSRCSSRRLSLSASLLDYSPFRFQRERPRRASTDNTFTTCEVSSQALLPSPARRGSQDSGAIMNESDYESESSLWRFQRWKRRVSAPSRLQHFGKQEPQQHHPLPILQTLNSELSSIRVSVEDDLPIPRKTVAAETCIEVHGIPRDSSSDKQTRDEKTFTSVSFKNVASSSVDEGIVNDCILEDVE